MRPSALASTAVVTISPSPPRGGWLSAAKPGGDGATTCLPAFPTPRAAPTRSLRDHPPLKGREGRCARSRLQPLDLALDVLHRRRFETGHRIGAVVRRIVGRRSVIAAGAEAAEGHVAGRAGR